MPTDRNQKQQQRQRRACFSVLSLTLLCMLALSNIERFGNSKQRSGRRKKAEDGFVCGRARVRHVRFPAKKMRRCTSDSVGNMLSDIFMTGLKAFQKNATYSISHCRRSGTIQNVLFGKPWGTSAAFGMDEQQHNNVSSLRIRLVEPVAMDAPDFCQACQTIWAHTCPHGLNYGLSFIRQTLGGIPAPDDMDDAAIHIRCGDVLTSRFGNYGFSRYGLYRDTLHNQTKSIGIITSSWNTHNCRRGDCQNI